MLKKKIIIIGAGIGGLSTGCYAQQNGFQSQIFEQHDKAGGLAATWKRKDYLIDGGIHFLSGHKPEIDFYRILKEVGLDNYNYIDMKTYARFRDEKSGISIDITHDLDKLHQDLLSLFPEDEDEIDEIVHAIKKVGATDFSIYGFEKPIELMGLKDKLKDYWMARRIWKYFTGKWSASVRRYVKNIKNDLFGQFLMSIFLPDVPVWFILMILSQLTTNQMCLLGDGSYKFAKSIESYYLDLGGKISYSTDVKSILVTNDKAIGVKIDNGQEILSDYVISAADGYHTIYELLNGQYLDEEIEKRYSSLDKVPPYIAVSYGVNRKFDNDPWLTGIKLASSITIGKKEINEIFYRIFNYSDKFAPPNKTILQVMFETEWDYWNSLRQDKEKYEQAKKKIASNILTKMEEYYPGISESVEVTDVVTPYTYWKYTRSYQGSIMGFPPTAANMMIQFKKTLPNLKNFYMAGQWSMSVGGVPPTIFSGRHVLQLICKEESKKFTTTSNS